MVPDTDDWARASLSRIPSAHRRGQPGPLRGQGPRTTAFLPRGSHRRSLGNSAALPTQLPDRVLRPVRTEDVNDLAAVSTRVESTCATRVHGSASQHKPTLPDNPRPALTSQCVSAGFDSLGGSTRLHAICGSHDHHGLRHEGWQPGCVATPPCRRSLNTGRRGGSGVEAAEDLRLWWVSPRRSYRGALPGRQA
jgi:hypothetical protein